MTVTLSWQASGTSNVTGYNVYRSTTSGSGYALICSTPGLTLIDIVDNLITVYYVVTSVSPDGESAFSSQYTATAASVPSAPTGVTGVVS